MAGETQVKTDRKITGFGLLVVLGLFVLPVLVPARSGGQSSTKMGGGLPAVGSRFPTVPPNFNAPSRLTQDGPENNLPAPRPSSMTSPATTYRGYAYWHHNDGFFEYDDTAMQIGHDFDFWNEEWRGYTEWDISGVPDSALVTYVGVQLTISGAPAACEWQYAEVCFYAMANRPSVAGPSAQTLFNDAGDGTQYLYGNSSALSASGTAPFIKLGQDAVDALSAARTSDWFAVGFIDFFDGGTENWDDEGLIFSSAALKVIYYEDGDDAHEENDVPSNAKNLAVGTHADLRCFDVDYFAVTVSKQNHTQLIRVQVTCDASVGELRVELYDLYSRLVANQSSGNTIQAENCVAETLNGTYTFAIRGVHGEKNVYALTIELEADCPLGVDPWVVAGIIGVVIILLAVSGSLVNAWRGKKGKVPSPTIAAAAIPSSAPPVLVTSSLPQPAASQFVSPPTTTAPPAPPVPTPADATSPDLGAETDFLEELPPVGRFCHHCGAELGPTDTFCKHCGLNLP